MTAKQAKRQNHLNGGRNNISTDKTEEKLQLAIAYHGEGRIDNAAHLYEEVLTVYPDNPCANFNLATIFHGSGRFIEAISYYKKAHSQDPHNLQVIMNLAVVFRDNKDLDQALSMYQQALEIDPEQPDNYYNLGVLYHQLGRVDEALKSFEIARELDPEHFPTLYNLGLICLECEWYEKALTFNEKAHSIAPDDMDCCYNMGLTYFHIGRFQESLGFYEKVFVETPEDAVLCNTIGTVYQRLNNFEKAVELYKKALTIKPDFGKACINLAIVLKMVGDIAGAIEYFQKAVSLGHDVESAEYMIAALTGGKRSSVPRGYIEDLFDSYADNFDKSLAERLDYSVPAKLYELYESLGLVKKIEQAIDLGCGTGLAGEQFRGDVQKMTGVDLSRKMIEQAELKGVYDHLCSIDIIDFLKGSSSRYDLIIAADVMVYIGDLKRLFCQIKESIAADGIFLFSVEEYNGTGYQLRQSGRYAYSREYIEMLASEHGLPLVSAKKSKIRKENEEWIVGLLFALQKA